MTSQLQNRSIMLLGLVWENNVSIKKTEKKDKNGKLSKVT